MKTIRYLSTLTHLVKSLRSVLHVPRGVWRRYSSSEVSDHSSSHPQGAGRGCKAAEAATSTLSRLALHRDEHTLHSVQLRFPG